MLHKQSFACVTGLSSSQQSLPCPLPNLLRCFPQFSRVDFECGRGKKNAKPHCKSGNPFCSNTGNIGYNLITIKLLQKSFKHSLEEFYKTTTCSLSLTKLLHLQVFNQLSSVLSKCDISVHLVEISPKLSEIQASVLTEGKTELTESPTTYMQGITKTRLPIFWYQDLNDVPEGKV